MQPSEHRRTRATRLDDLLRQLDGELREGRSGDLRSIATGFKVLDDTIGGGVHPGDLVLLGGPPGVGKTILGLQMARNVVQAGGHAVFICFEHEESVLAMRLLALESAGSRDEEEVSNRLVNLMLEGARGHRGLAEALAREPAAADALERLTDYGDRLTFVRASSAHTDLDELEALIERHRPNGTTPVIFIDYLQKIPVHPEPDTESEKVTRTVEALKDFALTHHVPIVVISAVDAAGMEARRLRLHHLRGSSAVAFEADLVLMLNDKMKAVSKVHLAYDALGSKRFRDWVVVSVEKNRGGPNLVDLEFRKDFGNFRFDPEGGLVTEKLVDERLDDELA